jgi:dihydrolipoamide dehydrogenase
MAASKGIDLIRGTGKLAGPGVVEAGGVRHTARHVVVATGSDPVIPPVPGLRELDGVRKALRGQIAPARQPAGSTRAG